GENPHVLTYLRENGSHRLAVLANFSEHDQVVDLRGWRAQGLAHFFRDVFTGRTVSTGGIVEAAPYELLWLVED
ncbi:MAG TPA: alpha-glucosidase C-terminal domain-containing protein, partial [Kiritimatiellia bacterium]|nr:alpha-glucosidase C-terminal domain-containing protein [Kiritimatiellia bacterium]